MAIEKTIFTTSAGANRLAELREWLVANATDYFDEITEVASSAFLCKKNNKNVIKFKNGSQSYSDGNMLYTANNSFLIMRTAESFNANYVVKTSKGILIHFPSEYSTTSLANTIFITKTQNYGLSIAFVGVTYGSTDYNEYRVYDFEHTPTFDYYVRASKDTSGLTSFKSQMYKKEEMTVPQPIPCHGTASYGVGLYQLYYSQFPLTEGEITANGKNYYSNGYLALEE